MRKDIGMEGEYVLIEMDLSMKDIGRIIKEVVKEE